MSDLLRAVEKYLETILKDRRFCPRCMGALPDSHNPDCAIGKLAAAYQEVKA
jgi:ribosomal protein S27AE